ncbi:hypothetical protein TIFTF001_035503 [Ficus carica]|uniref:Uncharacterized protein n=1 Tax=Ficus carica TaxID=3494 RepID=A0AA88E3G2_FICCA|nr:hypothetical protein TIFTF001_035503 [Ficus carica]
MTGIGSRLLPIEKVECCSVLIGTSTLSNTADKEHVMLGYDV